MQANERQKKRIRARQKAMTRLSLEFKKRFEEIYDEELEKEGIMREFTVIRVSKED